MVQIYHGGTPAYLRKHAPIVRPQGDAHYFGLYGASDWSRNWFELGSADEVSLYTFFDSKTEATKDQMIQYFRQVYDRFLPEFPYQCYPKASDFPVNSKEFYVPTFVFQGERGPCAVIYLEANGGSRNTWREKRRARTIAAFRASGIPCLSFFSKYPNYASYVAGRTYDAIMGR